MEKTIFEEMGGRYEKQGDYLIPCLALPTEKKTIGVWGAAPQAVSERISQDYIHKSSHKR